MTRRDFAAALAVPLAMGVKRAQALPNRPVRLKITGLKIVKLKVIAERGSLSPAWNPGATMNFRVGGGSFLEIHTDQGLTGIGPAIDPASLPSFEAKLVGKDPFDTENLVASLRYDAAGGVYRGPANVDIALWDVIGKACQQPIYKLIGGGRDSVTPYASMVKVSTPEERASMAQALAEAGWKAIKIRLHNATLHEDIRVVEAVRAKIGDRMQIMIDANQAQSAEDWQPGVLWDFRRALETARELQRLNCAWLEEPLARYAFDRISELNQLVEIPIAGGENSRWLHEYLWMLQQHVYDILQPETMAAEGITGMRKIGTLAQAYGRQITPHCALHDLGTIAAMHLVASFPSADLLEIIHDPPVCSYVDRFSVFTQPPAVNSQGKMVLPQGPGLGVEIRPDLVVSSS